MSSNNITFQFSPSQGYPVYLSFDLDIFSQDLIDMVQEMMFERVSEKDAKNIENLLAKPNARLLEISEASTSVATSIDNPMDIDRLMNESIIPRENFKVYRYKSEALMMYSSFSKVWKVGVFDNFGTENNRYPAKVIINRFLSWALVSHGVVGFWGVPVDEGVVVLRQFESNAEVVFFDTKKFNVITLDGVKKLKSRFQILRLDSTIHNRHISMSKEELLSFLSLNCTYLDHNGLSIPIRQMIQAITLSTYGLIHPKDSFKPRTSLAA